MLFSFSLWAQGEELDESTFDEEACQNNEFYSPEEEFSYSRRYFCPHRYNDFYNYRDVETETTWPGKLENSFMEDLKR